MARLARIVLCAATVVVAAHAESDEEFVVRTFFEHLASSMTQDSEAEETRASIAMPMLRSPAQHMSAAGECPVPFWRSREPTGFDATRVHTLSMYPVFGHRRASVLPPSFAAALIDDVAKVEKHLSSDGYEKSSDEPDRFVVVGAPWFSAEDVLKDVQLASKAGTGTGAGMADVVDMKDDAAVAAVISSLNPRELSDRLNKIVENPNVFVDPWKHVKAFLRKRSLGTVTDDEVGLANAALSQVYDVLASILGVGVRSEHDAVFFTVFGYEKAGERGGPTRAGWASGHGRPARLFPRSWRDEALHVPVPIARVTCRQVNAQLWHHGMERVSRRRDSRDPLPLPSRSPSRRYVQGAPRRRSRPYGRRPSRRRGDG